MTRPGDVSCATTASTAVVAAAIVSFAAPSIRKSLDRISARLTHVSLADDSIAGILSTTFYFVIVVVSDPEKTIPVENAISH